MSDFDERLAAIKANAAWGLVDLSDVDWLIVQLSEAQEAKAFVEAMEQAQMPGRCANCPIDSVCEESDTEACLDVRTAWQAWKEREK